MSRPDWQCVTDEALREPAATMRALASMPFRRYVGAVPRGDVPFWPPSYMRAPATLAGRRADVAATNRRLRDAPVHILMTDAAQFLVCSYAGEWRRFDGAQAGDDLPSLGALMWGCRYGQAAGRIARIIGLRQIPEAASA